MFGGPISMRQPEIDLRSGTVFYFGNFTVISKKKFTTPVIHTQGIYKNRIKNDRNIFEIPALLSS